MHGGDGPGWGWRRGGVPWARMAVTGSPSETSMRAPVAVQFTTDDSGMRIGSSASVAGNAALVLEKTRLMCAHGLAHFCSTVCMRVSRAVGARGGARVGACRASAFGKATRDTTVIVLGLGAWARGLLRERCVTVVLSHRIGHDTVDGARVRDPGCEKEGTAVGGGRGSGVLGFRAGGMR